MDQNLISCLEKKRITSYGNRILLKAIHERYIDFLNKNIKVCGWIRHIRVHSSKKIGFFEINDGSTVKNIQVIVDSIINNFSELTKEMIGGSIEIKGLLVKSIGMKQEVSYFNNIF